MTILAEFLKCLLTEGEVVFTETPRFSADERPQAADVLRQAYRTYCLDLAGPELPFREKTALASAEFVQRACWLLVDRRAPAEAVEQALALPAPSVPADHVAADLVLRYTPALLRRARALAVEDPLTVQLTQVLRQWPLSGVLADVPDVPLTPIEFGGHPGLLLLYAERLAQNLKPAWVPSGLAYEYVEIIFREAGRPVPTPWVTDKEQQHE